MSCPPRDTFQIGWICALPIETAAAAEMLDENFGTLEEQDAADSNTYTLGRIGKHHIVIACLPGGQYRSTSATTVANNMIRTFSKSLRIGLIVGIGGGIPSATHDIRLGDVVISYPQGTCGGVIQYDMGKVVAGGEFERTGSLNSPPRALLTAVSTMRAAALRDEPRYLEYLHSAIGRTARTRKNFGKPNAQCDRLFQANHDHPSNASSCDGCPAGWEETRSEREDNNPQPHYGIIASGNSVIKHGETREQLRSKTGALCFGIEAAGLMLDFPCIVIRGVCDYADSHRNEHWQGYAALTAASYTKELLCYVPIGHISQEALVVDVCTELKEEIKGTNQRLDGIKSQQDQHHLKQIEIVLTGQQRSCHQTFKVANYTEQKNINPKRVEGTCLWALQSPEYIRWSESTCNDLLWVSADPGCGKSVLARSIIDDCLKAPGQAVKVCYFFFKDNEEQNHLAAAMCSVLHQLFSQRPDLLRHAMPSWEKNGEKLRHEAEELWRIFVTAASAEASCKTICIFDALDECRNVDQGRLIRKLDLFQRQLSSSTQDTYLKFLVTSRPYDYIQNHFRAISNSFSHLHLKGEENNDQIHKEIDIVVKLRVNELAETTALSPDVTQRLERQLLQMEHRTYLWLHLAMDDIRSTFEDSLRPAEESIRMVPPSVNEAYESILRRVPSSQWDIVRKTLQIIVAARRPLTTVEMAMALGIAIFPQSRTAAEARLDSSLIVKKLRRLCGLFVFINNSKIYLIHQTAREFLIAKSSSTNVGLAYPWRLSDAEDQMARICLRYLLMEDLVRDNDRLCSSTQDFMDYSAVHWPYHVRQMDLASYQKAANRVHRLYDMDGKLFSLWFPILWKAARPYERLPTIKALHLAAFNGHEQEVQSLIGVNTGDVNEPDDTRTYAVVWASLNGHEKVVQLLLDCGADINAQGGFYGDALKAACSEGHHRIAQLLLERGANVNVQGGQYGNALQAACSKGQADIVLLLLDCGADINAQGGYYGNALQAACSGGHDEIVQILQGLPATDRPTS
ncbi:Putative Ankyrin repeat protein [Penicillium brasilianum]|uniref:Putative Ankyrin repeat protein n=1 Tax=Penicillium brasilianum TaxID=104259 RepID=A0A0F7VFN6_PENBI|nr:Putative Ankyrin repeat protein [Penicillium brasilianum]